MVSGCCDHTGRDEHGCWDCYNTDHTHDPSLPCEGTDLMWSADSPEHIALVREFADGLPVKHIELP